MSSGTTSPLPNALSDKQTHPTTNPLPHDRLETSRAKISATCAEYGYFNPTYRLPHLDDEDHTLSPPNPEQMKRDLQTLFEGVLALQSLEADTVYAKMAIEARDLADNEFAGFNWEMFQDVVGEGLRGLQKRGACG